jgi:hypothetical protein
MLRRIEWGREAFILAVARVVGTRFSSKDAISCHMRASRMEVRNSQKGICMALSFYGWSHLPTRARRSPSVRQIRENRVK